MGTGLIFITNKNTGRARSYMSSPFLLGGRDGLLQQMGSVGLGGLFIHHLYPYPRL